MAERTAELIQRHRAFWHREKVDRPLLAAIPYVPLAPMAIPVPAAAWQGDELQLVPEILDPAAFADFEAEPGAKPFKGDLFNFRAPFRRLPWVEAVLGCPIMADRSSGSIWAQPCLERPADWPRLALRDDNPWLAKLLAFLAELVARRDGTYWPVLTLMRGPIDLARAVLGDNALCLALYDAPEDLRDLLGAVSDVFVATVKAQHAATPRFHEGYLSPFGIWAPGSCVNTQADQSSIISARTYEQVILPFEDKVCRPFDYSAIHLHSGFLHTVPPLLAAELPRAIEIALDTGSTPVTTRDLVPVCRQILARKPLLIHGNMSAADLDYLIAELPPTGLHICAWLDPEDLAQWRSPFPLAAG
ncbi:MAG: hypothetical protein M1401_19895 [Chloroflexi bacterium]|nr:hypothetical protein [Chloroflexota bacterium]